MNGDTFMLMSQARKSEVIVDPRDSVSLATRLDDVSTTGVTYVGYANIGSSTSSPVWRIMKIDESGSPVTLIITWPDGNSSYDNIWDNRTSLNYL